MSVEGCPVVTAGAPCGRRTRTLGLCHAHYERLRLTGDTRADRPLGPHRQVMAYFEAHVMEPSDGCRDWPYGTANGYGLRSDNKRAHRETCERWNGPPPFAGAQAAHSCGRPICWAGEHLRWATARENSADRAQHGTLPRGERVAGARLTATEVLEIRALSAGGVRNCQIARRFGVAEATISNIIHRVNWAWLA